LISTVMLLSPNAADVRASDSVLANRVSALIAGTATADTPLEMAIADAFADAEPPINLMILARTEKFGEAVLRAMALLENGGMGNPQMVTDALAFFRAVDQSTLAVQVAVQLLLLERHQ